ncbi:alpha/beta fold hydrolase [Jiella mangrovi]|uniref:Alpha/beta fold hydrolase n=1 Tax=Jiella mangrovi TaxID=2821407 RepID=A0ABS4BFE3_9HYPH|nr:alpha/beta fold hydrolase [Jiella mangrovi]
MSEAARLHAIERGGGEKPPLVFLHGFDGQAEAFRDIVQVFAEEGRRCLAFDLPGHGRSREFPGFGPPKVAARAVLAELAARKIAKAHFVGHSMGGAVACLSALFEPARALSLTLLAPGGFGPEIDAEKIRAMMDATSEANLIAALRAMVAEGFTVSPDMARHCSDRAGRAEIRTVFDLLFSTGEQGVLPLEAVAATGVAIEVLWGEADTVTPVSQSKQLPPQFYVRRLQDAGHMLTLEAPSESVAAIRRAIARGEGA